MLNSSVPRFDDSVARHCRACEGNPLNQDAGTRVHQPLADPCTTLARRLGCRSSGEFAQCVAVTGQFVIFSTACCRKAEKWGATFTGRHDGTFHAKSTRRHPPRMQEGVVEMRRGGVCVAVNAHTHPAQEIEVVAEGDSGCVRWRSVALCLDVGRRDLAQQPGALAGGRLPRREGCLLPLRAPDPLRSRAIQRIKPPGDRQNLVQP